MRNEMKLLFALCDALGFEVETELDYMPRKESKADAMMYSRGYRTDRVIAKSGGPLAALDIDKNGEYTSLLASPIVSYKLTKKGEL